jgi:hypothetical protein
MAHGGTKMVKAVLPDMVKNAFINGCAIFATAAQHSAYAKL